jgi:hypothetical protein
LELGYTGEIVLPQNQRRTVIPSEPGGDHDMPPRSPTVRMTENLRAAKRRLRFGHSTYVRPVQVGYVCARLRVV